MILSVNKQQIHEYTRSKRQIKLKRQFENWPGFELHNTIPAREQ